ncbi:GDSL Lipase/Acylhydrolase [Coccidioides immitis RS]|uniref:GDSL Lipase/Acylhydrolase n=2 Tax=Coccidioides immitis TaxID=5501 RepID=J3KHS7_COCIM|nr:GDSL Lipase/Acylhydrolase [Coccidioides immitis RS]EAS35447.3 GDSL Lipase/Acylhydrolase [Coccidioides immitis RS]KMP00693.1 hypothetical protein CIRG_00835 [Coccidioides immitis RMSCC 2394]TPX26292.1 hypothetical protein DIZ76_011754 [Coccidioides immitis]
MSTDRSLVGAAAPCPMSITFDQFIIFGDSITQGASSQEKGFTFQPALQDVYIRRLDVINRGFSGYTSPQGLTALGQFFPPVEKDKVRLMSIFFGANDAVLPPYDQHVPLEKYQQCLRGIITHKAVNAQKTKLLLLTPPPVNEYQLESYGRESGYSTLTRKAQVTKLYADACREVGKSLDTPVVDIWSAFMKEAGWTEGEPLAGSKDAPPNKKLAELLCDGLHFTSEGYKVMYAETMKVIREEYPEEAPEKLPILFPPRLEAPWS